MRRLLSEFIKTTVDNRLVLSGLLKEDFSAEDNETNETVLLTRTFDKIKSQLQEDIQRLELNKKTLNSVLTRVSTGIATAKTLDNFLGLITETITEALLAKTGLILLIDKERQDLYVKSSYGEKTDHFKQLRFKRPSPLLEKVLGSKNGLVIANAQSLGMDASSEVSGLFEYPLLCCPLTINEQTIGLILISGRSISDAFLEDELSLLNAVAIQTALTINNEELKQLTFLDSLTGLHNYRYLKETIDYEIRRSKRYPSNLCLLMIDLDGFKSYNDTLGHLEGDALLQEAGRVMKEQLRATDTLCRYGGDEFSIILPQTDIKGATVVAGKIKAVIENLNCKIKITTSIGLSEWSPALDHREFVLKADSALYQAKKSGKNQIVVSS